MTESRITVTLTPGVSQIVRKIAERRGVDINAVIAHAFMLEYWAEAADRAGDEICHKNGKTGRITEMNLPWPEPKCETESPLPPVATKKIKLRLVANNPDVQPTPPRLLPALQSVADPAADPEDEDND